MAALRLSAVPAIGKVTAGHRSHTDEDAGMLAAHHHGAAGGEVDFPRRRPALGSSHVNRQPPAIQPAERFGGSRHRQRDGEQGSL